MNHVQSSDELMLTSDVAALLRCHQSTVSRLVKRGELTPVVQLPGLRGARVFHRDEVARVLAERSLS